MKYYNCQKNYFSFYKIKNAYNIFCIHIIIGYEISDVKCDFEIEDIISNEVNGMSIFEALMLICFGISWPISIIKALRTHQVAGKSPLFMGIVLLGYAFGILHKILITRDPVIFLYIFNFCMVAIDFGLYLRFRPRQEKA